MLLKYSVGFVFMPGGFEIAQTIEALRRCDEAQGFLYARPQPVAALESWLLSYSPGVRQIAAARWQRQGG